MYEYRATVIRVVDGDTVHLDVDLGIDNHTRLTTRLYGINAPETSTPEGKAVRDYLTGLLPAGTTVTLWTFKDRKEKYGRYLALLKLGEVNINDHLVETGRAVPYFP